MLSICKPHSPILPSSALKVSDVKINPIFGGCVGLAALACPCALFLAYRAFDWPWLYLTSYERPALLLAGPVLTAAVALISTVRPLRRQIS